MQESHRQNSGTESSAEVFATPNDQFASVEVVVRECEAVTPLPFSVEPAASVVDSMLNIDAYDVELLLQQLESINTDFPIDSFIKSTASMPTETATRADAGVDGSDLTHQNREKKKRRKATVVAVNQDKKEEKEALLQEMRELERRLECLMHRSGQFSGKIDESELGNAMLREAIRDQQLSMATAQSVLSGYLNRDYISPLNMSIRLGTDWDERRQTLLAMKERKIRNAYEYVAVRSKFLDPLKPHISDERFENAQGDYCCVWFDAIQFEKVNSVKQVYDAMVGYLLSMEISITERLGNLTVRDDYDFVDDNTMSSYRLLSTENGVAVETNGAMFGKYFESHELSNGSPCGVITVDFVDEDKLHPYQPHERVRKDTSAAIVLTPHWRKRARAEGEYDNGADEDELVVTMSRSGTIKLHKPEFLIEPRVLQEMRENADGWRNLMIKSIHELLCVHL
ncbi:hypothetical protein FI667_g7625, partial [Globisporangium splendens]